MSTTWIDKSRLELKLGKFAVGSATALLDRRLLSHVQDFRRLNGSRMYPLDHGEISKRIPNADYHVSRKIDGEFTVLVYQQNELFTINPGGTIRAGMPWQEEAASLLQKAGVKEAWIAGELYAVPHEDRRARVHDVVSVARQPQSPEDLQRLRFAVFDLVLVDGQMVQGPFADAWEQIQSWFGTGKGIHPVEAKSAQNAGEIARIFEEWVQQQGAEGLVARSETAGMFKIKPRHNLDAVVIGFTESTDDREGMMHDLLLAVMRNDGSFHVLSRVGGGFSDELRREMLSDLKDMIVDSEYVEVNSDHVAYQMVRPEWVIEISCLDLVSQTTRGGPINRVVLNWNPQAAPPRYEVIRRMPLASVISPQFVRRREDKTVNPHDVRIKQVADLVEVPLVDREAGQLALPPSQFLRREVYTKDYRGDVMIRKFLMWKTNKEQESEEFPAFVVHYTDFSPSRKSPLNREVRVSNSQQQIEKLYEELKDANIKKGWELYSQGVVGEAVRVEQSASEPKAKAPAKKQPAKKNETKAAEQPVAQTPTKKKATTKKADEAPATMTEGKKTEGKKTGVKKTGVKKNTKAGKAPAAEGEQPATPAPATKKAATKKAATKKAPTKKAATKKAATKKAAVEAEQPAAQVPANKKAPTKKAPTKKAATKKAAQPAAEVPTRKKAAKSNTATKPTAKKSAAKKSSSKKSSSKKSS